MKRRKSWASSRRTGWFREPTERSSGGPTAPPRISFPDNIPPSYFVNPADSPPPGQTATPYLSRDNTLWVTMTAEKIPPIGAFSDVTRLSKKALYCYEKKGLLVPVERDICTGYRYYTPGQIERGIWIGSLCSLGFTLDETARILSEEDRNSPVVQALLKDRLRQTQGGEMQRLSMVERVLLADDPFEELFKMELQNWTRKEIPPHPCDDHPGG
ncbi:MerR family transcriptional regulator [Methanogenium cariaci]|uniref:MerR family transcriptional regulator n=1 Tax=Methanogenium cariaci TaxID=2197 RepID=UPI000786376C|nr:MerR family transcriptional regulator [Methanogenium cariaci]